jgi:hypothetical protein
MKRDGSPPSPNHHFFRFFRNTHIYEKQLPNYQDNLDYLGEQGVAKCVSVDGLGGIDCPPYLLEY